MEKGLITHAVLESLAGTTAFRRGKEYFSAGAVERLRASGDKITARVEGTETYQVELRDDDGDLAYDCTCPRAADGYFCKHCVAVGLAWLAENSAAPKTGAASGKKKRSDPWRDIREYLTTQPPEALVDLLLDVSQRGDRLYQSLLLKADTAAMLAELAEYAIERVENSLEQVDDSNGEIGGIVYRLGELHVKACTMARPEPAGLAERLFRFETTLPFGLCSFDAATYRDALGKEGLRRYRELAEAEWRKLKPRNAKDGYDAHRSRITRIMERLAEASGDVEELVAIKSRDLSSGYSYLDIAEIWTKAKQLDKALEWAERGLNAFPERPDNRLRDFLVVAYLKLKRKRNDEALQLTWIQFEERPILEHYKKLHNVAGKLGLWPEQRNRALAWVAEVIAREASTTSRWKPKPSAPNTSLRVEIALWENDFDAAWESIHEGICDRSLLIALAGKLESSRPDGAISLYRRVVPPIVEQTNNTAYEEAIKLIRKVGGLMKAQNQSRPFGDYLAELRVQFKPKRNFIKLLDGVARSAMH